MYLLSFECNFSAMLMRRKASTSRCSRDVLVLPESTLHWSLVDTEYNFRALLMRRRQVQRGAAELYLSSYRINNAEESAVDYRVQLQRNVDEEGGKYTEAQPRCT